MDRPRWSRTSRNHFKQLCASCWRSIDTGQLASCQSRSWLDKENVCPLIQREDLWLYSCSCGRSCLESGASLLVILALLAVASLLSKGRKFHLIFSGWTCSHTCCPSLCSTGDPAFFFRGFALSGDKVWPLPFFVKLWLWATQPALWRTTWESRERSSEWSTGGNRVLFRF